MNPARTAPSYLSCIFTSPLTARLSWCCTWGTQILSVAAWGQLALASDYPRTCVMWALHKGVHTVFATSPGLPQAPENTTRTMYAIAHRMPWARSAVVAAVGAWVGKRATWRGIHYIDTDILRESKLQGFEPVWCSKLHLVLSPRS